MYGKTDQFAYVTYASEGQVPPGSRNVLMLDEEFEKYQMPN